MAFRETVAKNLLTHSSGVLREKWAATEAVTSTLCSCLLPAIVIQSPKLTLLGNSTNSLPHLYVPCGLGRLLVLVLRENTWLENTILRLGRNQ